jgi:hypothetical protein
MPGSKKTTEVCVFEEASLLSGPVARDLLFKPRPSKRCETPAEIARASGIDDLFVVRDVSDLSALRELARICRAAAPGGLFVVVKLALPGPRQDFFSTDHNPSWVFSHEPVLRPWQVK